MAHTEKKLDSQTLFQGRIIEVHKDSVELENGKKTTRELVIHHGGVCIVALDDEDRLLLVKQFRYPYQKEIIELTAKCWWNRNEKDICCFTLDFNFLCSSCYE